MSATAGAGRLDILAFPRYGRAAPSSRYRMLQYVPLLRAQGIDVEVSPLLGDWYVERMFAGQPTAPARMAAAFLHRMRHTLCRRNADLVWIEKELLPYLPWPLERLLLGGRRVVLDLDDSQFHRYDEHRSRLVRGLLGDKIDRGMAASRIVTCGSPYIAERAQRAGARQVIDLPTAIDLARYPSRPTPENPGRDEFVVGWIGTPGNTRYLAEIAEPLRLFAAEAPLRMILIGGRPGELPGLPVEYRDWSEAAEIELLQEIDVGVMPLPDLPWERGKCGLKLLQYMASWKPAIASPVGVNSIVVEEGVSGFLARNTGEWLAALRRLHADPALRQAMGAAGRARVAKAYSLDVLAPRLAELLRDAAQQ